MFWYQTGEWWDYAMLLVVVAGLIIVNEIARRWKPAGILIFVGMPIIATVAVTQFNSLAGSTAEGSWFPLVKHYSAVAGCLGFLALRYIPRIQKNKWALAFPPLILAINIAEAVYRDIQCASYDGADPISGLYTLGGPWNYMNAVAGILNIVTITGWAGIVISRKKTKDMLWPDMLWFWIIAYDLWNWSFTYNCLSDVSWYCGVGLLVACTIPAFFIQKGAWLQHRAFTLGFWTFWSLVWPNFARLSRFAHPVSRDPNANFTLALAALLFNIGVFVYMIYKIWKTKRNPYKQELFVEEPRFREVVENYATPEDCDWISERTGVAFTPNYDVGAAPAAVGAAASDADKAGDGAAPAAKE